MCRVCGSFVSECVCCVCVSDVCVTCVSCVWFVCKLTCFEFVILEFVFDVCVACVCVCDVCGLFVSYVCMLNPADC